MDDAKMKNMEFELLKELCAIRSASGDEGRISAFLLDHIRDKQKEWKFTPEIYHGQDFQECIVLVFGKPRTAVYAHMDSIGFTVRYADQLVRIGAPHVQSGMKVVGSDRQGELSATLEIDEEHKISYRHSRPVDRGTVLTFAPDWRETDDTVQCCYMDNRLGVWNALRLCEDLENGAIVFSCREEHGGGSVPFLARFLFEKYGIRQALISDITWVTEGVHAGKGAAISLRDSGIPRKSFTDRIEAIAERSGIPYQLEVEGSGGSDGTELQKQPYPIDWCFIGAPEENVHTPDEKVHKKDIASMTELYRLLMKEL
jgi:putative aminopeptidase FrvX